MGKKRKSGRATQRAQNGEDDDGEKMAMPDLDSEEYFYDEIEQHALKKDKILLEGDVDADDGDSEDFSDEEDEVMQLDDSDDENLEEDQGRTISDDEEGDSDDDEDPEAGLPSAKAWGRKKSQFYDTDIKDVDDIGNNEEDQLAAEEEEKEAISLQQRMTSHLSQEDFDHFDIEVKEVQDEEETAEMEEESHVKKDLSKLSDEEAIQILLKESPELFELMDDYQAKITEVINRYHPLLLIGRSEDVLSPEGKEFVELIHPLYLQYCTTISFYLALKAKNENVKDHPIIERLVEYRNLISNLEPIAKKFEDEMDEIVANAKNKNSKVIDHVGSENPDKHLQAALTKAKLAKSIISEVKLKKKNKKPSKQIKPDPVKSQPDIDPLEYYNQIANKIKEKKIEKSKKYEANSDEEDDMEDDNEDESKRGITYEMAKNKGMTRKRKKELRNPRVKHKMKFKKAIVRRKSQIPMQRSEAGSYGGELTGIKSNLTKSVKIK